ncbi:hypothetical protein ACVBGC_33150 [Burkholderia stagnalis]
MFAAPRIDCASTPESAARTPAAPFAPPTVNANPAPLNGAWRLPRALPASNELFLWRFRAGWRAASHDDPRTTLSAVELQRAKASPTPAVAKRYLAGCMALRHIFSRLLACEPGQLEFAGSHEGALRPLAPGVGPDIEAHVIHAGIWIMIAVSATPIGIGTALPGPARAPHRRHTAATPPFRAEGIETLRERALHGSLAALAGQPATAAHPRIALQAGASTLVETTDGRRLQALDIPMPGQICCAIACAVPIDAIYAIGWTGRWTCRTRTAE